MFWLSAIVIRLLLLACRYKGRRLPENTFKICKTYKGYRFRSTLYRNITAKERCDKHRWLQNSWYRCIWTYTIVVGPKVRLPRIECLIEKYEGKGRDYVYLNDLEVSCLEVEATLAFEGGLLFFVTCWDYFLELP